MLRVLAVALLAAPASGASVLDSLTDAATGAAGHALKDAATGAAGDALNSAKDAASGAIHDAHGAIIGFAPPHPPSSPTPPPLPSRPPAPPAPPPVSPPPRAPIDRCFVAQGWGAQGEGFRGSVATTINGRTCQARQRQGGARGSGIWVHAGCVGLVGSRGRGEQGAWEQAEGRGARGHGVRSGAPGAMHAKRGPPTSCRRSGNPNPNPNRSGRGSTRTSTRSLRATRRSPPSRVTSAATQRRAR